MKATLEFTLPDEREEYADAANGWKYRVAIQDMLNHLKMLDDSGHEWAVKARDLVFDCCKDNGFDPWE